MPRPPRRQAGCQDLDKAVDPFSRYIFPPRSLRSWHGPASQATRYRTRHLRDVRALRLGSLECRISAMSQGRMQLQRLHRGYGA